MAAPPRTHTTIALIGDSDISRWPSELYPTLAAEQQGADDNENRAVDEAPAAVSVVVSGHSGETLVEVIPHVQETLTEILSQKEECGMSVVESSAHSKKDRRRVKKDKTKKKNDTADCMQDNARSSNDDDVSTNTSKRIVFVICAGENDIGNGISLDDSTQSLDDMLSSILNHPLLMHATSSDDDHVQVGVIFLGPKFEPWIKYDASARKDYIRMSRSFEACFQKHHDAIPTNARILSLYYVDCLTMFCGKDAEKMPGALFGGKAQAQDVYFDRDELHLSHEGYKIWKQVVEECIRDMLSSSRRGE